MKKQIPPAAGSLRDDSVTDSHPDLHSLINSLIDQNNKLKKENKNLRTLIPPDTKPIGFLESLTGSIKGSLTSGSVKGSVTGGSVKGSVTGGSIKGSVTGGSIKGSVTGSQSRSSVKGSENGSMKGSVKGSLSGGSLKGSGSAKGSAAVSLDMDPFAERILLYPKVIFQISIESIHNLECYITVWTKIKDKIAPIDSTETVKYDESLGIFKFAKTFEIPYLIGIDNDQMVIFEIFDGDTKQIRQGYFWAAVSIKLPYIVRAESVKLDIMRGEFYLGALHINPSLGSHEEKVSIKEAGTEKLLFFKSKKPSLESLRAAMPTMKQVFAFYNIAFKTGYICPVGPKLLGERGAIFLKLCTNRTNKEAQVGNNGDGEFKTNEFVYEEAPTSRKLVILWTSSLVTTPPYDVKVLEIKFSHEDITDNLDPRLPIDENANLIFQIYLDGIFNIPKLVHYATIPVQEFLNNCKPDRRKRPVPFKLFFNPVFDFKSLEKNVNEEKDEKGSVDSFEGEVNTMTQPVVPADDVEQGLDDFDRDNDDPSKSMKSQKHDRKNAFIELIIKKEKHEFELTTGDMLYEKKLRESLVTKTSNWQYNLRESFFESWTEQAESIRNYKTLMEASVDGWSLDVLVVADLHFACFQHMAYKLNPQLADVIPVDSTYLGSSVIDTIKLIYTIVAPLLRDNAIRSFAGGGVGAPHSNYPSCSSCRHVGTPLVQEYLLSLSSNRFIWDSIKKRLGDNLKFNALCKTEDATENYIFSCQNIEDIREILDPPVPVDSDKDINPLIACLETASQFESWGGYSYVETNEYYSWAHLYSGLLESTSLYLPSLASPETFNDDAQSVRSNSKSVKSYKSAKSVVSAKSEKSGSTDRCTTNDLQNEILEKKRNKLRTGVSRCGILKPKAVGTELLEFIDDKFKMHSSVFDVDIEAINGFLLSRDKNEMTSKQSDVLIWALGKCPSDHSIEAVGAMIERHILSENKTALLIVLSAEDRFDLDDDDSASIEIISNPFRKFLEVYHSALTRALAVRAGDSMNTTSKQKPKDNNDESKYSKLFHDGAYNLCLVHYVTFKEIMMRSFLDMDKTTANNLESATTASARSKKGKSEESADVLPTYGAVLNVLKLFLQDNHAEHIIGLDDIEDEDENEMTMESAKDIVIGSLTGSVIGSVMGSETGKPPTIDDIASKNNSVLGAKAKLLIENIDEQSEVLELKKKFDEERDEILTKGISNFVANFLNRMKSEKEIYEKNSFYNKSCMSNPEVLCPIT